MDPYRYYAHTGKVELGIEDAKFATARKAQIQALALAEATKSE